MVICGISKSDSSSVELQNANGWGRYTAIADMSHPVESSKRRKQLDDSGDSGMMTVTKRQWNKLQDDDKTAGRG